MNRKIHEQVTLCLIGYEIGSDTTGSIGYSSNPYIIVGTPINQVYIFSVFFIGSDGYTAKKGI